MQTTGPARPKLYLMDFNVITSPKWRFWNIPPVVTIPDLRKKLLQLFTVFYWAALPGCPCTDLAVPGPAFKIILTFLF